MVCMGKKCSEHNFVHLIIRSVDWFRGRSDHIISVKLMRKYVSVFPHNNTGVFVLLHHVN